MNVKAESSAEEGMEFNIGGTVVDLSMAHIESMNMFNFEDLAHHPDIGPKIEKELREQYIKTGKMAPLSHEEVTIGPRQLLVGFNNFHKKDNSQAISDFRKRIYKDHAIDLKKDDDIYELPANDTNFHAAADTLLRLQLESTRDNSVLAQMNIRNHPELKIMADFAYHVEQNPEPMSTKHIHLLKLLEGQIEKSIKFAADTLDNKRPFPEEAIKDKLKHLTKHFELPPEVDKKAMETLVHNISVAAEMTLADRRSPGSP